MTARTRNDLKQLFEQGDTPQGQDYSDLIDSFVALQDSTPQNVSSLTVGSLGVVNVSATTVSAGTVFVDTLRVGNAVSSLSVANLDATNRFSLNVTNVSAVSTTQAGAVVLNGSISYVTFVNGSNDAVKLPPPNSSRVQYIVNNSGSVLSVFPDTSCAFVGTAFNTKRLIQNGKGATVLHVSSDRYALIVES